MQAVPNEARSAGISFCRSKSVDFSVVEVREYAPSISLNPSVKDGYAVGLGWEYTCDKIFREVDDVESSRPPPVTSQKELRLDTLDRRKILHATGEDMKTIEKARKATIKAYHQRRETVQECRLEENNEKSSKKWYSKSM
jgi:hypothetical protein